MEAIRSNENIVIQIPENFWSSSLDEHDEFGDKVDIEIDDDIVVSEEFQYEPADLDNSEKCSIKEDDASSSNADDDEVKSETKTFEQYLCGLCKNIYKQQEHSIFLHKLMHHPDIDLEKYLKKITTSENENFMSLANVAMTRKLNVSFSTRVNKKKVRDVSTPKTNVSTEQTIPITCGICGMQFKSRPACRNHINALHPNIKMHFSFKMNSFRRVAEPTKNNKCHQTRINRKQYACEMCPAIYGSVAALWYHNEKVHSIFRPVKKMSPPVDVIPKLSKQNVLEEASQDVHSYSSNLSKLIDTPVNSLNHIDWIKVFADNNKPKKEDVKPKQEISSMKMKPKEEKFSSGFDYHHCFPPEMDLKVHNDCKFEEKKIVPVEISLQMAQAILELRHKMDLVLPDPSKEIVLTEKKGFPIITSNDAETAVRAIYNKWNQFQ